MSTAGLRAASVRRTTTREDQFSLLELQSLQQVLVNKGIAAPGTKTVIKDWRLNLFANYRRVDDPAYWGDISPCGPLLNTIKNRDGRLEGCYQWKAGDQNIKRQNQDGRFIVRIRAHDIPVITLVLPWLSFLLAVFGIVLHFLS